MGPDEKRKRFHSHDVPSTLPWRLDTCGRLIPASTVYHEYVERAFFNDYEFFMRTLFRNLDAEMEELLERYPKKGLNDSEFLKLSEDKAHDRYGCSLSQLSRIQKISLVKLLYHSVRTNAKQLASISGFTLEEVNGFVRSRQVRLNTSGPDGGIGFGGL
ncbi:MAG: hypothetical protein IJV01_05450 [Bacteroidales bacterium]|nr:hypothetical protein [Bacteroidales bacterium]